MKVDVRILEFEAHQELLHKLFLEGSLDSSEFLYQDRRHYPSRLWNLIRTNKTSEYFAAFENEKIIGCSARIEHRVVQGFEDYTAYLDTDLFVSPLHRKLEPVKALVKARFAQGSLEQNPKVFYWGVEHVPQNLNLCNRLAPSYQRDFEFLLNSTLYQIPSYESALREDKSLKLFKLKDLDQNQIKSLQGAKSKYDFQRITLPAVPNDFLSRLAKDEEDSWVLTNSDYSTGVILTSLRNSRRWLTTGRLNLELEKLKRVKGYKHLNNVEIKFLMLGSPWGSGAEISNIILSAQFYANLLGFDYLVFRDLPKPTLLHNAYEFRRRVFFIIDPRSDFKKLIMNKLSQVRIETFFV